MALGRTANPSLNDKTFDDLPMPSLEREKMTLAGTVNKSAILLALVVAAAAWSWSRLTSAAEPGGMMPLLVGSAIGGLVVAIATVVRKHWAPVTAPIYAVLEGVALGIISAIYEARFSGIVFQAVLLTLGVALSLFLAYRSGLIKATENFKLGVVAATGGIFLLYLIGFVMSMFGSGIPYIHESGTIGILFSLFVVVIAALNLVLDFDFIEQGAERGAPKYMEWYGAFGLMVTLIWLYLEMLRLLAKLADRR